MTHKELMYTLRGNLCERMSFHYSMKWLPLIHIIISLDYSLYSRLPLYHEEVLIVGVGASGYIGKAIASSYRRDGFRIHRLSTPNPATLPKRKSLQRKSSSRSSAIRLTRTLYRIFHSPAMPICHFLLELYHGLRDDSQRMPGGYLIMWSISW